MKKLLFLILFAVALNVAATSKDTLQTVSMVSYEQGWLDNKGTIALHNNTNDNLNSVEFRIEYLDMKGKQLDYKEFSLVTDIAPDMTKKYNIPAYEHDRNYSYYTSEADLTHPHRFKIRFEVIGYNRNVNQQQSEESSESQNYSELQGHGRCGLPETAAIFVLVILFFISCVCIGLYVLVAVMAKKRHRSVALWLLISLIATPVLVSIILLFVGESEYIEYGERFDNDK